MRGNEKLNKLTTNNLVTKKPAKKKDCLTATLFCKNSFCYLI